MSKEGFARLKAMGERHIAERAAAAAATAGRTNDTGGTQDAAAGIQDDVVSPGRSGSPARV